MDTRGDDVNSPDYGAKLKVRIWNRVPVRLGLGVLLITWTALALSFLLFSHKQEQLFTEQHIRVARNESVLLATDFAQQMLAGGGREVWHAISSEAVQHRDISDARSILLFTTDGRVKAATDIGAIGSRIEVHANPACPHCDSTRPGDFPAFATVTGEGGAKFLRVVNAIPISQECMRCHEAKKPPRSLVAIDYDLAPLERDAAERRDELVLTALVAGILIMALIGLLFRMLVMRSVDTIARSAGRLASGNLAARAHVVGRNEFALLARDFNHMAGRIEAQVAHIEAAHAESELLYTLVVEASKTLETHEVATGVARVLLEKLRPRYVVFFLETADGGWTCTAGTAGKEETIAGGEGMLEEMLRADGEQLHSLVDGTPAEIVADACRAQTLQTRRESGSLHFALPVVADARLVGLLVCAGVPSAIQVGNELLENLGVHLRLAAINSRNYTGAITDGLTRLKNKRYGLLRLEQALYTAKRYQTELGLLVCDIDHFKRVNDSYGHPAGDAVLREVSRRIAGCVRKSDIAVRYGGEEFMLILPDTEARMLAAIAEKLRAAVSATPIELGAAGVALPLAISVGVAACRAESDTAESLIARADAALYRAKEGGRNRVEVAI